MSDPSPNRWPSQLWVVRHGESAGNVARDAANAAGLERIDIGERDVDVPLSPLGLRQAHSLGRWFRNMAPSARPTAILSSPYRRALQTAEALREEGGLMDVVVRGDERLREKEFGMLNRLTRAGITRLFPEQAALRETLGKFYHRPPAGESWCDVILRLRSLLDTVSLHYSGEDSRVLIVAHQVVVLCLRYLLEDLDEARLLAIDSMADVANCGVTTYELTESDGALAMRLTAYNFVAPLVEEGTPVTSRRDSPAPA